MSNLILTFYAGRIRVRIIKFLIASALAYVDKKPAFRRAEKASKKDKNFIFLEVYGGMFALELSLDVLRGS